MSDLNIVLQERLLQFLKANSERYFNPKQLAKALELNAPQKTLLQQALNALENQNKIKQQSPGTFKYHYAKSALYGVIDFNSRAQAFVAVDGFKEDVIIQAEHTGNALQGDTVTIELFNSKAARRKSGRVLEVVKRARNQFVGSFQKNKNQQWVVPDHPKIHVDFILSASEIKANIGDKVVVSLLHWNADESSPTGQLIKVLGMPGQHTTEINAIMVEFGLPDAFSDSIQAAAQAISEQIPEQEIQNRKDFRKHCTFTIDPQDAKDFDDALSVQINSENVIQIGVHIADVTHYVKPGTELDEEAYSRATSVYLVDRCIPMLPERLSNNLCSLRPHEDKLCFSAVFELNLQGQLLNEWFGKTVIHSRHRFTYEQAQEVLNEGQGTFSQELNLLNILAKRLRTERHSKGSVFFDREEVKFDLDEHGVPRGVYIKKSLDAHKLIEEFMLLANRRVSLFLETHGKHSVFRVHEDPHPEKLQSLADMAARFGHKMDMRTTQRATQSINTLLQNISQSKERGMLELLALRTMPKAYYSVKNKGHYGLGFNTYTHFTSPIRRYPDMMVHRLLEQRLLKASEQGLEVLESQCKHSSEQERMATDAERASIKFKQVEFMNLHLGETFEGIISGVSEWGVYVELTHSKCEGMIRTKDLGKDYFVFEPEQFRYIGKRSRMTYALGDIIRVTVDATDMHKKQIQFKPFQWHE